MRILILTIDNWQLTYLSIFFGKAFMSKGDDIEERLINFAVRIINLCAHLPENTSR
jgi:hypothetical protein